jgi:methyltransferase (TIGR00027 family)
VEPERAASRTAVLVCQGRAAADGRLAVGWYSDPVAMELLRAPERAAVNQVRANEPPAGWSQRSGYEAVRACAELMAPRTFAIDEGIRAHPCGQVVILGAGLDTRAWRLPELAEATVWEIDHPASQRDKRDRLGALATVAHEVRFQPVDLAGGRLDAALESGGHRPDRPTTWIWEGVIPYLSRAEVADTLRAVAARSATGSTLILNYQSPSLRASAGRLVARAMTVFGGTPVTAGEPWRSLWTPQRMARLLADHDFAIESDSDLRSTAERIGLRTSRTSLSTGRVAVAAR